MEIHWVKECPKWKMENSTIVNEKNKLNYNNLIFVACSLHIKIFKKYVTKKIIVVKLLWKYPSGISSVHGNEKIYEEVKKSYFHLNLC